VNQGGRNTLALVRRNIVRCYSFMWRLQSAGKNLMVVALLCVKQALVRGLGVVWFL